MNIFAVESCPVKSAQSLPDKLIVKMPLESAQMLSTAHRVLSGDSYCNSKGMYKTAHLNHPCSIWVRKSSDNYEWLYRHFVSLSMEFEKRYKKQHKSFIDHKDNLAILPYGIQHHGLTKFAQAMPDIYKNQNHIKAYRDYMINEKHYAKWEKGTSKPIWWN